MKTNKKLREEIKRKGLREIFKQIRQDCKDVRLDREAVKHYQKLYYNYVAHPFLYKFKDLGFVFGCLAGGAIGAGVFSDDVANFTARYIPLHPLLHSFIQASVAGSFGILGGTIGGKYLSGKFSTFPPYRTVQRKAEQNRKAIQGRFNGIPGDFNLEKLFEK